MARRKNRERAKSLPTMLKVGDPVMVIAGGGSAPGRDNKGTIGKILRFTGRNDRVVVEGVNIIKRRKAAMSSDESSGIIEREASIHVSNVMYYSEEQKCPRRLGVKVLDDGRKVRGYRNRDTGEFEQIDV